MQITNDFNIDDILGVWLLNDEYQNGKEQFPDKELFSATSLLKPIQQYVLTNRIPYEQKVVDLSHLIASRLGNAIHDSIEKAWTNNYQKALKQLGYSDADIATVRINPKPEELNDSIFPVYLEQRYFKELDEYVISGQIDQCIGHQLCDIKSTSTFIYMNQKKDEDYKLQGSIYRWLNPNVIKDDKMKIHFIFTDWQSFKAKQDSKYPQTRVLTQEFELHSLEYTENYIRERIRLIKENEKQVGKNILRCTDKELWRNEPEFKFYRDASKAGVAGSRSTKNFKDLNEALNYQAELGGIGKIITVESEPKACLYCSAFELCSQRKEYF